MVETKLPGQRGGRDQGVGKNNRAKQKNKKETETKTKVGGTVHYTADEGWMGLPLYFPLPPTSLKNKKNHQQKGGQGIND